MHLQLQVANLDGFSGFTFDEDSVSTAYIALSYEWGDLASTRTIFVNRHPLQVTRNLYDFLLALFSLHLENRSHPTATDLNKSQTKFHFTSQKKG